MAHGDNLFCRMKQMKLIMLLFLSTTLNAQKVGVNEYSSIDKKVLQLPDSLTKTTESIANYLTTTFKTENERVRGIFVWVAANIQYDVENMFAINFYERKEDKISKPLKTRKGICENYAALFNDICLKSGIKSFVIEGYTKQNELADYIPHAWCAAFIDSAWFMFDPTWGSGYLHDRKFYKKLNNHYFKVQPSTLIKAHMPFDYLWQFLNYPITNQEFYDGKTQQNKSKPYFNYIDSILVFEKQNPVEQLVSSVYRIENNGIKNSLIFDRLQHLKLEIEHERQTRTVNLYNSAVADYNGGVNSYNDFIQYRNKQFMPMKSDPEIQNQIDSASNKLKVAKTKLSQIANSDATMIAMMKQLEKSVDDVGIRVKEQQDWLKIYFSKGKSGRKGMFKKITWFGIPLN